MTDRLLARPKRVLLLLTASWLTLGVSACASLPHGGAEPEVTRLLKDRSVQTPVTAPDALATLTTRPMSADSAVQMALVKSPKLALIYGQLGLDQADVLQALEVANPRLGLSTLTAASSGRLDVQSLTLPLADLVMLPSRARLAQKAKARSRFLIAEAMMDVQLDVEAAWINAVAAEQVAQLRMAVAEALATSAALAERYFNAGNISELDLSRQQAAASEAMVVAHQAAVAARTARASLDTLIGRSPADGDWPLTRSLPLPPDAEDGLADLQALASRSSLALMAADQDLTIWDQVAATKTGTRLLGATAAGLEQQKDAGGIRYTGLMLDLELPIFNQGQAQTAHAIAKRDLAKAHRAEISLNLANQIAARAAELHHRREIIDQYGQDLVPQRRTIVARSQEQQNYMLLGVFALIDAKTQEYDAYQGYIEAVRDYGLARVELTRLVGARLPSTPQTPDPAPSAADLVGPGAPEPNHMHDHATGGQP